MRSISVRALSGPNVFGAGKPVIAASIDFGDYRHRLLRDVPALCERMLRLFPSSRPHVESPIPEVFLLVLRSMLREMAFDPNVARIQEHEGAHTIAVDFVSEHATVYLFRQLFEIYRDVNLPVRVTRASLIERAKVIEKDTDLGPSTRAILFEATRRGIPWLRLDDGSLMQLGFGSRRKLLNGTESQGTGSIAVDIASNKDLTKSLLRVQMVPVPRGGIAATAEDAVELFRSVGPPVAVKPLAGHHGDSVYPNLSSEGELRSRFADCSSGSRLVIVEESFRGKDYRVVVVGGRVVAACERRPASVVGDGVRAIYELIDNENQSPLRGDDYDKPLCHIEVDAEILSCLSHSGLTLASVPEPGRVVPLREAANVSKGGTTADVTDSVHPQVASMCVRAARSLELDIAGIDLITPDIAKPLPARAGVIEVNAAPGISMHHCPDDGLPRNVARAIVELLFPDGNGRIPIVAITGSNGKTAVARMIAHVLRESGVGIGVASSDGIFLGNERIAPPSFDAARCVLSDSSVDVAVIEYSESAIIERGLAYDFADVAVVTNWELGPKVSDHLELPESRVAPCSLVTQRVRDGGRLVINAGDSTAMALLSRPRVRAWRKEIALCALSAGDLKECLELELGGCSYLAEDGSIVEAMGGAVRNIAPLSAVPTTLGGRAAFQTMNALLAVAASRGLGLEAGEVARHISTFGRDGADDGIFTLYRVKAGHVILDRGGNALGYRAVSDALDGLDASRRTCVVAGSRKLVEPEAEVLARRFHKIIIHDGREGGGKSRELTRKRPDCRIVTGEAAALATALGEMMEGEVVVHFYTDMTIAKEVLREFGAQRTELLASNDFLSGLRAMNADLFAS